MSLDSLPACVKKCLQDAAKSAGCGINDVKCICTKDVSTDCFSDWHNQPDRTCINFRHHVASYNQRYVYQYLYYYK
ncbi:hypothetical protein PLIIFM63780_009089 [Purpureocillium lilacinum]|nr:hypothetical protein PLIIFM63780_009089 [Purpureocillium lilacinum]